ncbi:MAG: autotransporter-associated beta strand repeat-containing protein [Planctomycetaceae bacterium]
MPSLRHRSVGSTATGAVACLLGAALAPAAAQDQISRIYAPGVILRSFGYDPTTDAMYLGTDGSEQFIKISSVSSANPISQAMIYTSSLQRFYTNNDPNLQGEARGMVWGMVLNPKPIGSTPAYSFAVCTDTNTVKRLRPDGTRTTEPAAIKRIYTYDLGPADPFGDATDALTSRVTLLDLQTAAATASTISSAGSRQAAWSGDGASVYFSDTNANFWGLWKVGALSGGPQRLLATDMENSELGVSSSGSTDRIFFAGITGTSGIGNAGGIDFVTHDGVTTTSPQVALGAATLQDFLEQSSVPTSQRVSAVSFHGTDMYFFLYNGSGVRDSNSRYPGIYRLDGQGRLAKVVNKSQRAAAISGVNLNFDHPQPREILYAGTSGTFPVTQVLYREGGANAVAGATAFKPVDFNRDDRVTAADLALFTPQVTIRGQVKSAVADLTYDMNGNDTVDWKDVQIVQGFLDYVADPTLTGRIVPTLPIQADADLDGVVDFDDFLVMRATYGTTSRSFTQGDYNGDNQVSFPDLQPWINSYGFRSAVVGAGVPMAPFDQAAWDQFLAGITPPTVTLDVPQGRTTQFQAGYRTIVIAASVTKTGTGTLVFDAVNTYTGTTVVAAGTLELAAPAAVASSVLRVQAGATARLAGSDATAAGLDLAGGLVDVAAGGMTVPAELSPSALVAALLEGRGDGSWTGSSGVTSSVVAAAVAQGSPRAVGWVDNGDGSLRFSYSAPGDTNIDFSIDILDAANFLALGKFDTGAPATWLEGDFGYDGIVDILDAADFFATGLFDAGSYAPATAAITAVPEPSAATVGALAAALIGLARRSGAAAGRDRRVGGRRRDARRPRRNA